MKVLKFIIKYWYYFFVLSAFTNMFGLRNWYSILIAIVVVVGTVALFKIKWNKIDLLVLMAMLYSLLSVFFSDYDMDLYYYGIKGQVAVMFFYFIARTDWFINNDFIDNIKWPLFVVIVAGIYLYYNPPSWYEIFRYANLTAEEGTHAFYEHTRMSSFWPHPYFLGYGSCFFIIYITTQILVMSPLEKVILSKNDYCQSVSYKSIFGKLGLLQVVSVINKKSSTNYLYILIALFTLFFSQMRVAIAYTILFMGFASVYSLVTKRHNTTYFKFLLMLIIAMGIMYYVVSRIISEEFLYYVTERTTEHEGNLLEERANIYRRLFGYISVFGHGLGRFGHAAARMGLPYISDQEYLRLSCELGFVGGTMVLLPFLIAIKRGLRNISLTFFETSCLIFYLFAMLGAAPLEATSQHSFLLWFCVGHIISKTQKYAYCPNHLKLQ